MNEAQARAWIERSVAAGSSPALSSAEVDDLVALAAREDDAGRTRGDAGWTPIWNLAAAEAQGWSWKSARVAGEFSFAADGTNVQKGDLVKVFAQKAAEAEARAVSWDTSYGGQGGAFTIQVQTAAGEFYAATRTETIANG